MNKRIQNGNHEEHIIEVGEVQFENVEQPEKGARAFFRRNKKKFVWGGVLAAALTGLAAIKLFGNKDDDEDDGSYDGLTPFVDVDTTEEDD